VDVDLVRRDLFDPADAAFIPVADFNRLQDEAVSDLVKRREAEGSIARRHGALKPAL